MQTALPENSTDEAPEFARQSIVALASTCRVKYGRCVLRYFLDLDMKHTATSRFDPHYMDKISLRPFSVLM